MKTFLHLCLALQVLSLLAAPTIPNPSFEANAVFTNGPGYLIGNNAVITGWSANQPDRVGLNPGSNFSPFADAGAIPDGSRAAFIQSIGPPTALSTTITGLTAGTWYRVQFRASWRGVYTEPNATYRINGEPAVSFVASPTTNPYYTINAVFRATAATAPLVIGCTPKGDSGDATLLVDNFTITAATPIVVTKATDDGSKGTLRAALATAVLSTTVFNVITFAPALNGATITLTAGEIDILDAGGVAIDASALSNGITISGGNTSRIFNVDSSGVFALRALTLTGGTGGGSDGGAIYNLGNTAITACTFIGNGGSSGSGAAIRSDGGTATLANCTLSGNLASPVGGGGAIVNGTNSVLTLTQCTVSGNSAGTGSGIYNQGTFSLVNSIVADTGPAEDIYNDSGNMIYVGANIVLATTNYGGTVSGPSPITADPLLSALASNGGPTQTMAIASSSPARNAAVGSTSTTDQRGFPIVGTPDIGAFEMQGGGTFSLVATTYSAFEGGVAEIVINRTGNLSGVATVVLFTTAGTATTADFTARANSAASAVTFLDGQSTATVAIPITADNLTEPDEIFTVKLASPTPTGATLGTPSTATVTIHDAFMVTRTTDDGSAGTLRAVIAAAASSTPHAISFAPTLSGMTITLTSQIVIAANDVVTVDASSIGGVTISGGSATRLFYVNDGGNLSLRRLTLSGGNGGGPVQDRGLGGAAFVKGPGGILALNECLLKSNSAGSNGAGSGGAVFNAGGTLILKRCTLSGNNANLGGAVYASGTVGVTSLEHCTVSGNAATGSGGGIYNFAATTTLVHCTITGNTAPAAQGSGVASLGANGFQVIVEKSIVAGNTNSDVDYVSGATNTFISAGENVIGTGNATGKFIQFGDDVIGANSPELGALASNGGFTQTHALLPGSPAIDRAAYSIFTADQRGFMINGVADSGAYESQQGGVFEFVGGNLQLNVVRAGEPVTVTIQRSGGFLGPATVRVFTANGSAPAAAYTPRPNTSASDIRFADGELTKDVSINTAKNAQEGSFKIFLGSPAPAGASSIGPVASQFGVIAGPIVVTNVNDDGPGSLRQAIAAAASSDSATSAGVAPNITFAPALSGKTITLGSEIVIGGGPEIRIDASTLPKGITIDGAGYTRLFSVNTGATLSLRGLTLTGGKNAGNDGGAIDNLGTLMMTQCSVLNSSSFNGGGIANELSGSLTLRQCTIFGNNSYYAGGGILVVGPTTMIQCTVSGNSAAHAGGGVEVNGPVTMDRCVIAGNTASGHPENRDVSNNATTILSGLNIIPYFGNYNTLDTSSGSISTADPLLGPLADNGGPTQTMALMPGSPAINAGSGSAFTSDQRGFPIIDAPDVGAYEAQLGGTFVFNQTGYGGYEGSNATLSINRLGGSVGTASVRLTTTSGAAGTTDFTPRPDTSASDVFFDNGETTKTITIPLAADSLGEVNETFTVKLSKPSPGTALGNPATATVAIVSSTPPAGTDKPPVLTLASPAANASVNVDVGGSFVLTGTATDDRGVAQVGVYLNGHVETLLPAVLEKPGAPRTSFKVVVGPANLTAGINSISTFCVDGSSQLANTLFRSFKVLRPLDLNISGFGSVTSGFAPRSYREEGKPLTLKATPGAGYLFTRWTILSAQTTTDISASDLELPTLTFTHREGLALRASFVPNPYTAPNIAGNYIGWITPSTTQPTSGGTGPGGVGTAGDLGTMGLAAFTLQTNGAFTGTLKLDGTSYPIAGAFDEIGNARFGATRATNFPVTRAGKGPTTLVLIYPPGQHRIGGFTTEKLGAQIVASSNLTADRAFNSKTDATPFRVGFAANDLITLNLSPLPVGQQEPGFDTGDFPQGHGYASGKLSATGALTLTGLLPDNTAISLSSTLLTTLSGGHPAYLFTPLYSKKGLLLASVEVVNTTDEDLTGTGFWICPPISTSQYYPFGWPESISLTVKGSKLQVITGKSIVKMDAASVSLDFLDVLDSNTSITYFPSISNADLVTPGAGYTLKIDRKTGLFSGTYTLPSTPTRSFEGIVRNKNAASPTNLGFWMTPAPKVSDGTGTVGTVKLNP